MLPLRSGPRLCALVMSAMPIAVQGAPAASRSTEAAASRAASVAEHRAACAGRDGWSDPAPPVRIFGDVYDVGTCGIAVLLLTGDRGAVLFDGATAAAVPSILANIRRLGLRPAEVRLLLSSHEHSDHAGGLAALQQATGATMVATAASRAALASGVLAADDPQRESDRPSFRGARVGRLVRNGEVVRLGSLRLTAIATPGHAPGGTSWAWRSCEGRICRRIVYADSVTPVSVDGFRFRDHPAYVAQLRQSLMRIAALPCDIIVTPHPSASNLYERLAGTRPLVDARACAAYAAAGEAKLSERLAAER